MANKFAVASGAWSSTLTWSDTDGGSSGAALPANTDTVFISEGVSVLMDTDQSAFANGLNGVTIRGSNTIPGMLYFANGTSGYLKIAIGYNIVGTAGTYRGRILANSDGVWGNTGDITYVYKAVIDLRGTSSVNMTYLSAALYGTNPSIEYTHTYGQIFSECVVDAVNDTLIYTGLAAALPNGTLVQVDPGSGALPTELSIGTDYWVVEGSGNTIKLSLSYSGSAIDLSAGGPIDILIGKYENCTVSGNYLIKPNHGLPASTCVSLRSTGTLPSPLKQDIQYWVANSPTTDGLLLTTNVRLLDNVIQLGGTYSGVITLYTGGVGTYGVPGTNPYTTSAVNTLTDVTSDPQWSTVTGHNRVGLGAMNSSDFGSSSYDSQMSTIIDIKPKKIKLSTNIDSIQFPLAALVLTSRNVSVRSYSTTGGGGRIFDYISNYSEPGIFKCEITNMSIFVGILWGNYAIYEGRGHIISGCISACFYHVYQAFDITFSGVIIGGAYGLYYTSAVRIGGLCVAIAYLMIGVRGGIITAKMFGNGYIAYECHSVKVGGYLVGAGTVAYRGTNIDIVGELYSIYIFNRYGPPAHLVVRKGATIQLPLVYYNNSNGTFVSNQTSYIGGENSTSAAKNGVYFESYDNIVGDVRAYLNFGEIIKNTTVLRTGGGPYTLEATPLSLCNATHSFPLFDWREEGVAVEQQRRSVFIKGEGWTSFPTAAQLFIEAEYVSDATTLQTTTIRTTAVLTDNTTWTEFVLPLFTPAIADYVIYRAHLETYEAGAKVYVDCKLNGSTTKVIFKDGESKLLSILGNLSLNDVIESAGGKFKVPPVDMVEKNYPYGTMR